MSGAPTTRNVGRPRSIDRDKIVAAANRIGLERLTMRAIATELGVTTQALYNHIGGRQELVLLLANRYDHCFEHDPEEFADWQSWLATFARALRDHLVGQRGLASSATTGGPTSPAALRFVDVTIDKMAADDFAPVAAFEAYRAVLELVVGWVQHGESLGGPETAARERSLFVEAMAQVDHRDVTHLGPIITAWGRSRDDLFDYTLKALLAGIEQLGPQRGSARPS